MSLDVLVVSGVKLIKNTLKNTLQVCGPSLVTSMLSIQRCGAAEHTVVLIRSLQSLYSKGLMRPEFGYKHVVATT